tara:strand:+ start:6658 stop:7149 length:492 start_codon:yes stop_codon:yes gene_type:complete
MNKSYRLKCSVSISSDVIQQAKIVAENEERSFSRIVEMALRQYLNGKEVTPVKELILKTPSLKVPPKGNPVKKKSVPLSPPSVEEVKAFFRSIGGSDRNAEDFFDYWSDMGWRRGNRPMKSWEGSARMWMRRSRDGSKSVKPVKASDRVHDFGIDPKFKGKEW